MLRSLRNVLVKSRTSHMVRLYSASASENVNVENEQLVIDEVSPEREAEIEVKKNKSRLSNPHFNLVNDRRPYDVPMALAHKTVKYNRKLYGKYGSTSGINPSICWPSQKDIDERQEYERVAFPYTIQDVMTKVAQKRQEEKQAITNKENLIAAKMLKMEQWKKELNDKISKKISEALAAKEKKERLVEEVRRHFGFKLDPRDERFQEMLAKREKEQKKIDKIARKEAKEKQMIAKLQKKSADLTTEETNNSF